MMLLVWVETRWNWRLFSERADGAHFTYWTVKWLCFGVQFEIKRALAKEKA
jgi:hypothetical protein